MQRQARQFESKYQAKRSRCCRQHTRTDYSCLGSRYTGPTKLCPCRTVHTCACRLELARAVVSAWTLPSLPFPPLPSPPLSPSRYPCERGEGVGSRQRGMGTGNSFLHIRGLPDHHHIASRASQTAETPYKWATGHLAAGPPSAPPKVFWPGPQYIPRKRARFGLGSSRPSIATPVVIKSTRWWNSLRLLLTRKSNRVSVCVQGSACLSR